MYAAAKGSASVVSLLEAAGVDVNAKFQNNLTSLMWAAGHVDATAEADGIELVKLLIDKGASVDEVDDRGRTALMIAAGAGHDSIVEILLRHGAVADRRDGKGLRAADLAKSASLRDRLDQSPAR